eukprot:3105678-Pleurochrysis_carterae.AAC.1
MLKAAAATAVAADVASPPPSLRTRRSRHFHRDADGLYTAAVDPVVAAAAPLACIVVRPVQLVAATAHTTATFSDTDVSNTRASFSFLHNHQVTW